LCVENIVGNICVSKKFKEYVDVCISFNSKSFLAYKQNPFAWN